MIKKAAAIFSLIVNCKSSIAVFFILLFSLFTIHYSLFTKEVHAQACEPGAPPTDAEAIDKINRCAIEKNIFDDKIFNINQIAGTTDSLYNLLTGRSRLHPETNDITAGTGALATSGRLVASLYSTPPASGVLYFADQIQKFNPVQSVYAQEGGIGFAALQPVQDLWTVFRNISYVGFVIVFVIMGFMIMFRAHISPQAVATVQDSIPRIVIALILVTFSYAIAGLMIDIMFLVLNIIIKTLEGAGLLQGTSIGEDVFTRSVFGVIWGNWKEIVAAVATSVAQVIDDIVDIAVLDRLLSFFGGSIGAIIVGIAVLFIMFRVFFMLLMAYVMIIVLTIFAPFFFLFQALPGKNGAGEWFKQMASQVAVFPTVAIMFVFAGILGGLGGGEGTIEAGQVGQFPLLSGGINPADLGKLIGVGLILMTPSAAELVKNALGAKGPQVGAGIGAGLAGGAAVVGGAARRGGGALWERGPIAERMEAGRMKRQEAAAEQAGIWTYTQQRRAEERKPPPKPATSK